jgi:hypothetical protein
MEHSPKLAILQSLDSMDAVQMEEVLKHIRRILNPINRTISHQVLKREAMQQIAQALKSQPVETTEKNTGLPKAA